MNFYKALQIVFAVVLVILLGLGFLSRPDSAPSTTTPAVKPTSNFNF